MKRTTMRLAIGVAATVVILAIAGIGLRSRFPVDPPKSELQVLLRRDGRRASGHVEIRNVQGDIVKRKTIGESGETTTQLDAGQYTVVSIDDAHCRPETVHLADSPNAVFIKCRS